MSDWSNLLLPAAVLLVIPAAIIAGHRRPTGPILVSAALAAASVAIFWLVLGGMIVDGAGPGEGSGYRLRLTVFAGGLLLTLSTWALALNAAAQARRWLWVALLIAAGLVTMGGVIVSMTTIPPCFPAPDGTFTCPTPGPLRQILALASYLACPVAGLIFAIRAPGRLVRALPEGLVVSSLHAGQSGHSAHPVAAAEVAEGAEGE